MCEEFPKRDEWTSLRAHGHQLQIKVENNIGVGDTSPLSSYLSRWATKPHPSKEKRTRVLINLHRLNISEKVSRNLWTKCACVSLFLCLSVCVCVCACVSVCVRTFFVCFHFQIHKLNKTMSNRSTKRTWVAAKNRKRNIKHTRHSFKNTRKAFNDIKHVMSWWYKKKNSHNCSYTVHTY